MKSSLRTLLLTHAPLTAIVGADGVFVGDAAQGKRLPYVVFWQTSSDENNTLDGPSGSFRTLEFEIDAKGRNAGEANDIAETVREFLKDYAGAAGSQVIDAVIVDDEYDSVERPVAGSDQKTFVVTLDVTIQYHPS